MNVKFKYRMLSCLAMPACILLSFGCDDSATNPKGIQASEFKIQEIYNVVWTLTEFQKAGKNEDISTYPPFQLIFAADELFGNDGCNDFAAEYEVRNDSIFPGDLSLTLRLCIRASFSTEHLTSPFRIQITAEELCIFADDALYIYKSVLVESVENSPLPGIWRLSSSTDPEFAMIQTQELLPTLSFDANRQFTISWYCIPENPFGCDEIGGIFGIGANGKILFYQRDQSYHGQGPGEIFMQRILSSASYRIESQALKAGKLTLFDSLNGAQFQFDLIAR